MEVQRRIVVAGQIIAAFKHISLHVTPGHIRQAPLHGNREFRRISHRAGAPKVADAVDEMVAKISGAAGAPIVDNIIAEIDDVLIQFRLNFFSSS